MTSKIALGLLAVMATISTQAVQAVCIGLPYNFGENNVRNLFPPDTSFESGRSAWISWSDGGSDANCWGIDSETAVHGKKSLWFKLPVQLEAYRFRIEKGIAYTLSYYLKSETNNARCRVMAWTRNDARKDILYGRWDVYSNSWQRYSFTIPPQDFTADDWRLIVSPINDCCFWIDGIQLEKGTMSEYQYNPCFSFNIPSPGNVLFADDLENLSIEIFNPSKADWNPLFSYKIFDYDGNMVTAESKSINITSGKEQSLKIKMPGKPFNGFYTILGILKDKAGNLLYEEKNCFCVVPSTLNDAGNKKYGFLGTSDYLFEASDELLSALKKIGSDWYYAPLRLCWSVIEPQKGKFVWDKFDRQVDLLESHGFKLVGYIWLHAGQPIWASESGKREKIKADSLPDFENFIFQMVERYKDRIHYWDILSESDLLQRLYNASEYADILKAAYRGAKRADPNCVLAGCSVSNGDTSTGYPYTREVLRLVGRKLDGFAPHPYTWPRNLGEGYIAVGPGEYGFRDHLQKGSEIIGDRHMWVGEYGFSRYCLPDSDYARTFAEYMAQSIIYARSIPNLERILWFNSYTRWGTSRQDDYGLWTDSFVPMPAVAVFATAAQFLNDVTYAQPLNMGKCMEAWLFKTEKRAIVALWTSYLLKNQTVPCRLEVPDGKQITAITLVGSDITRKCLKGKIVNLTLSSAPVYVVGEGMSLEDMHKLISVAKLDIPPQIRMDLTIVDSASLSLFLANFSVSPIKGSAEIQTNLKLFRSKQDFDLPVGGVTSVIYHLEGVKFEPDKEYPVAILLDIGGQTIKQEKTLSFLFGSPLKHPVNIDGRLDDWRDIESVGKLGREQLVPPDAEAHRNWTAPDDLSVPAYYFAYDSSNLYFACQVKDDIHRNSKIAGDIWNGDAIQLAVDTQNDALDPDVSGKKGYNNGDFDCTMALRTNGVQVYEYYPQTRDITGEVQCYIRRDDVQAMTIYELAIPVKLLSEFNPQAEKVIGFSFVVFDDDTGKGQDYRLEFSRGITGNRIPAYFKKIILK